MKVTVTVRLPSEVAQLLEQHADSEQKTQSLVVSELLEEYLADPSKISEAIRRRIECQTKGV